MSASNDDGFQPGDRELLIRIAERLDAVTATVKKIDKTVNGNGRPGLVDRMARVETRLIILGVLVLGLLGYGGVTLGL